MCAGPYSQRLLGIDEATSVGIERELVKKEDNDVLRPVSPLPHPNPAGSPPCRIPAHPNPDPLAIPFPCHLDPLAIPIH